VLEVCPPVVKTMLSIWMIDLTRDYILDDLGV